MIVVDDCIFFADSVEIYRIDNRDSGRAFAIILHNGIFDSEELGEFSLNSLRKIRNAITKLIEHS